MSITLFRKLALGIWRAKAFVSWSSGKDSAFALHEASRNFEIAGVLTTVNSAP
jgi:diphthamide synthase (EF-2-diphthine--ammonia ligase)